MKERYSKQAVNALKAAEKTAEGRSHNYVGTEHLLAGLLKETAGTAGLVLAEAGVEEMKLLALIDKLIAPRGMWHLKIHRDIHRGHRRCLITPERKPAISAAAS